MRKIAVDLKAFCAVQCHTPQCCRSGNTGRKVEGVKLLDIDELVPNCCLQMGLGFCCEHFCAGNGPKKKKKLNFHHLLVWMLSLVQNPIG